MEKPKKKKRTHFPTFHIRWWSRKTITERKCRNVGTETMRQQNREEKREKEKSVRNASVMFSAVSLTLDKWRKCYVIKWKRTKLNSPAAAAADGGGATPHDAWYSIFACTYIQHTSVAHLRHLNAPFASKNWKNQNYYIFETSNFINNNNDFFWSEKAMYYINF